jgi:hypothetical protein
MILTVEYSPKAEDVEIFCDREGLEVLLKKLNFLGKNGGHVHLMTPSWAGNELTEETQGNGTDLINHLRIAIKPD